MSTQEQPSEAELRAAYEAEMKRVRVEDLLLESVVNLINFGMRRTGLMPDTESERDPRQVELSIESVRALMPLLETAAPEQAPPIRQALSQLQLAYVRIGAPEPPAAGAPAPEPPAGGPAAPAPPAPAEPPVRPGEAGPAQRSGRLWVPGS